jgi:hypothetical protein
LILALQWETRLKLFKIDLEQVMFWQQKSPNVVSIEACLEKMFASFLLMTVKNSIGNVRANQGGSKQLEIEKLIW